jgi:hypothetical protein
VPKESLTGLRRIDRDLYHEVSGKDERSEWIRAARPLDILLFDIRMISGGSYRNHSEDPRERTVPSRRITAVGSLEKSEHLRRRSGWHRVCQAI